MKTRELAEILLDETDVDCIEVLLLAFLHQITARSSDRSDERMFARFNGYYWLPCIICGTWHGGQEKTGGSIMLSPNHGTMICEGCTGEAKRINERWPAGIEVELTG